MTMLIKCMSAVLISSALALPAAHGAAHAPILGAIISLQQDEMSEALRARRAGDIMPYKKLKAKVEKELKAKVIGQRLRQTNLGMVYELRLKNAKSQVIFAIVNARTGKIIQRSGQREKTSKKSE